MVKDFLNSLRTKVSEDDYKTILAMTVDDIKFNRTSFNKKTRPGQFIQICKRCCTALSRCDGGIQI